MRNTRYEPRKPERLAERRETERAVIREIEEVNLHGRLLESCPECGSADYHHVDGCMVCLSCGYTPCGVH
jgi:hypothetical protein